MGVDGFWPIVSSKGKLVTLDILSDKVIAIDASIWIYQFANALKDGDGEPIRGSHLVGFFKRICKLLFLRIKPIFVFDGPPIPLKFAALRKRQEDAISDAVFRKAAGQILRDNLGLLKSGADFPVPASRPPPSESSVEEIYVLSESSGDELSPSRRLRLTVPEEFRGFISERRTLDCVNLPVSPEKYDFHEKKLHDVKIDMDTLRDLPLHEQYRGLLQARSALLSQGRRNALNVASRMNSGGVDLAQLSLDQVEAFVKLARVTDMSKSIRMEMIREANKEEEHVYVPDPALAEYRPSKKRRPAAFNADEMMSSSLVSAQDKSRNELLFGDTGNKKQKEEVKEEEDVEDVKLNFGSHWNDIVDTKTESSYYVSGFSQDRKSDADSEQQQVDQKVQEQSDMNEQSDLDEPEEQFELDGQKVCAEQEAESDQQTDQYRRSAIRTEQEHLTDQHTDQYQLDGPTAITEQEHETESGEHNEESDEQTVRDTELDKNAESAVLDNRAARAQAEQYISDLPDISDTAFYDQIFTDTYDEFDERAAQLSTDDLARTYAEIQELLTAFGIPWVSAPADAEAQCACLCDLGLADAAVSDDSDTLLFGNNVVVFRKLFGLGATVEMFRSTTLGFTKDQLISFALLLGCDFTEGVKGIGPVNATEIVRHYSGIEGLREFRLWADRTDIGVFEGISEKDEFKRQHENIRHQWIFPHDFPSEQVWDVFDKPFVDRSEETFSWAPVDPDMVDAILKNNTDLSNVEATLMTTLTNYNKTTLQRRITDYFSPQFDRGQVAQVVSKRMAKALEGRSL